MTSTDAKCKVDAPDAAGRTPVMAARAGAVTGRICVATALRRTLFGHA